MTWLYVGLGLVVAWSAAYWYYCPMTDAEFLCAFEGAGRRAHMACYWTPGIVPAWAFLLVAIVKRRPRGRLVRQGGNLVGSQTHSALDRWQKPDPKTFAWFWHESYAPFKDYEQFNVLVEV